MSVLGVVCMILGVAFIITLLLEIILHDINKIFNRKLDLPIRTIEYFYLGIVVFISSVIIGLKKKKIFF
mgnify:FL=1